VNTTPAKQGINRYGARNTTKPINFYFAAPTATSVVLVGDFNNWDATSHPMQRQVDGCWFLQVQLTHGHHLYRFLVDGKPFLDPRATGIARYERNEQVSLIAVSMSSQGSSICR
jgi:1,4-alpha-glucan branching enzyme